MRKIIHVCGPSAAGKTTLVRELAKLLPKTAVLDGDILRARLGLLGRFTSSDRLSYAKNIAEAYNNVSNDVHYALGAFITPTLAMRDVLRKNIDDKTSLVFIWLNVSLNECAARDPKGLYGDPPKDFPGVNSALEVPSAEADCIVISPKKSEAPLETAKICIEAIRSVAWTI